MIHFFKTISKRLKKNQKVVWTTKRWSLAQPLYSQEKFV